MSQADRWPRETEPYTTRIAALDFASEELKEQLGKFPGLPSFAPTEAGSVRHRSLILVNQTLSSAAEVLRSIRCLWSHGHFLAAAHCIRLLLEQWGLLAFLDAKVITKLETVDGAKIADERLKKLQLGTKSGPLLPAGVTETIPAINVMEFVRAGEEAAPGFEGSYILLCDVSHPSIIHFDFLLLRSDGSWANPVFAKEAHRILEKVTSAAESAVAGIASIAISTYQRCLTPLQVEIDSNAT